jgi:hypothetical protein
LPRFRRRLSAGLVPVAVLASLALAPAASAHEGIEVGEYLVEVGWLHEPAFVGQPNAVQVTVVHHADEKPVTDLAADALSVVVSTAGADSPSLALTAAFDDVEMTGPLGEYDAALVPTAPGDYTFHITGSIKGTAVDLKLDSGEETFDPVVSSSDLQFPAKVPDLGEVATRLDRIDGRISALQSAAPGADGLAAAQDAAAAATAAASTANQALLIGALLGGAGVVIAAIALALSLRARRGGRGAA